MLKISEFSFHYRDVLFLSIVSPNPGALCAMDGTEILFLFFATRRCFLLHLQGRGVIPIISHFPCNLWLQVELFSRLLQSPTIVLWGFGAAVIGTRVKTFAPRLELGPFAPSLLGIAFSPDNVFECTQHGNKTHVVAVLSSLLNSIGSPDTILTLFKRRKERHSLLLFFLLSSAV